MKNFLLFIVLSLCISINAKSQNYAYSWGYNDEGQLGTGSVTWLPQQIGFDNDWKTIASGDYCSIAIKTDGTLWAWGDNSLYQLGDSTIERTFIPIQIGKANDWASVAMGGYWVIALKTDGTMWAWGSNYYGKLGDGQREKIKAPKKIINIDNWAYVACSVNKYQGQYIIALKKDGSMWGFGSGINFDSKYFIQLNNKNNWASVSCSSTHILALNKNGSLWTMGENSYGQLGNGTKIDKEEFIYVESSLSWLSVECSNNYSVGIKSDGTLWAWGRNQSGQLGDGTTEDKLSPVQIGTDNDWKYIKCWGNETIGIKSDGSLWAWGNNSTHHFGEANPDIILRPIKMENSDGWKIITKRLNIYYGGFTNIGIKTDGTLWGWGNNFDGGLGRGRTSTGSKPKPISKNPDWTYISSRCNTVNGIKSDGTLWSWGTTYKIIDKYYNLKGINLSYIPIQTSDSKDWASVATGDYHSLALKTDGSLWSWGTNIDGQLGDSTVYSSETPVLIGDSKEWASIKCGGFHNLALKKDGSLWAWGYNENGQLGDGTRKTRLTPFQIENSKDWSMISCGSAHNACIKQDGTLWTWGLNENGQLGKPFEDIVLYPKQVDDSKDWVFVSCGDSTTFAIKSDGSLWGCGYNSGAQLCDSTITRISTFKQLGKSYDWVYVSGGIYHAIGIKADGTLWSWGSNFNNQLGDGSQNYKIEPTQVGKLKDWVSAVCGAMHTIALKKSLLVVAPELSFPYDLSPNITTNVKLVWRMDETVESYKLELSDKEEFLSTISYTITSDTAVYINNIENNRTYFWRVKAYTDTDSSEWSEIWKFTTATASSIKEIESQNLLIIPNPASDFITIKLGSINLSCGQKDPTLMRGVDESTEIAIYNTLGVKVMTESIHPMAGSRQMSIQSLPCGIYFVKVCGETAKFVKM